MQSQDLLVKLERARKDLDHVESSPNFNTIKSTSVLYSRWEEDKSLAIRWCNRANTLSISRWTEHSVKSLLQYVEGLASVVEGPSRGVGGSLSEHFNMVRERFERALPSITFDALESSELFSFSRAQLDEWLNRTAQDVNNKVQEAERTIKTLLENADSTLHESAVQAAKDFENAKEKASEISIASAVEQFDSAQKNFLTRLRVWGSATLITFLLLVVSLLLLYTHPPLLIEAIMQSVSNNARVTALNEPLPLLIIAAAYYTSIRLSAVAILGIAFAFSLRMARAYLHLIEHNEHKLRVTKSIQAFVAAVRTGEQKDLVLGKLIEAVTEFSDPGILSTQSESSLVPQSINIGGTPSGSH